MRMMRIIKGIVKRYGRKKQFDREVQIICSSDLFDREWYRRMYLKYENCDPAWHYAIKGWKMGNDPSPWFSTKDYLARYHDVRDAEVNPLIHYEVSGKYEFRMIKYQV